MNLHVEEQEETDRKDANSNFRQMQLLSCLTAEDTKSTYNVCSHYCVGGLPYGKGVAMLFAGKEHSNYE